MPVPSARGALALLAGLFLAFRAGVQVPLNVLPDLQVICGNKGVFSLGRELREIIYKWMDVWKDICEL